MKIELNPVEVFTKAVSAWCPPNFDGVVHLNRSTLKLEGHAWTSNTYTNPEGDLIEVYRLPANWLANEPYQPEDFFTEEEIKIIKKEKPDWQGDFEEGCEALEIEGEEVNWILIQYLLFCNDNAPIEVEVKLNPEWEKFVRFIFESYPGELNDKERIFLLTREEDDYKINDGKVWVYDPHNFLTKLNPYVQPDGWRLLWEEWED